MRVTSKGEVTIPKHIRHHLGITPGAEVDFVKEGERVYLEKKQDQTCQSSGFRRFRGAATVRMTTDEIMALMRGEFIR